MTAPVRPVSQKLPQQPDDPYAELTGAKQAAPAEVDPYADLTTAPPPLVRTGNVDLRPPTPPAPLRMPPVVVSKPDVPTSAPPLPAPTMAARDATRLQPDANPHAKSLTGKARTASDIFQSMADNPVSTATAIPLAPIKSAFTAGRYIGQKSFSTDPSADADASRSLGVQPITDRQAAFAAAQLAAVAGGGALNNVVTKAVGAIPGAMRMAPVVGAGVEGAAVGGAYDEEDPTRGALLGSVLGMGLNVVPRLKLRRPGAAEPLPPERQLPRREPAQKAEARVVEEPTAAAPPEPDYTVEDPYTDLVQPKQPAQKPRAPTPEPVKGFKLPGDEHGVPAAPKLEDVETSLASLKQEHAAAPDELTRGELTSRINMLEAQRRKLKGEPEPEMAGAEDVRRAKAAGVRNVKDIPEQKHEQNPSPQTESPTKHEFSSTQLDLPPEASKGITTLAAKIPDADLAKDGRETEPHITVKHGLHGNEPEKVRALLADEKPLTVTLGKTSLFPDSGSGDVVKVDVDSPELHALNKKIADALPHTDTHPNYQPHATVAYVKPGLGKKYEGDASLAGQQITLHSLTFSGQDGKKVEIPLGGKETTAPLKLGDAAAMLNRGQEQERAARKATLFEPGERVRTKGGEMVTVEKASERAVSIRFDDGGTSIAQPDLLTRVPAAESVSSKQPAPPTKRKLVPVRTNVEGVTSYQLEPQSAPSKRTGPQVAIFDGGGFIEKKSPAEMKAVDNHHQMAFSTDALAREKSGALAFQNGDGDVTVNVGPGVSLSDVTIADRVKHLWKGIDPSKVTVIRQSANPKESDRTYQLGSSYVPPAKKLEKPKGLQMDNAPPGGWSEADKVPYQPAEYVPANAGRPLTGHVARIRAIAKDLKRGDERAIGEAAPRMARGLPKNAILVPAPDHTGDTSANKALADAIAKQSGAEVFDILARKGPTESSYERRQRGEPGLTADEHAASITANGSVPAGRPVHIVDNVMTTGATIEGAKRALGRDDAKALVYAKAPVPAFESARKPGAKKLEKPGAKKPAPNILGGFNGVASLTQFPSGRWGFVGGVDARLNYKDKVTGAPPTDAQITTLRNVGERFSTLKRVSWDSPAEAIAAADAIGQKIEPGNRAEYESRESAPAAVDTSAAPVKSSDGAKEVSGGATATAEAERAERPSPPLRGGTREVAAGEPAGPVRRDEASGDAESALPERGPERGDVIRRPDGIGEPGSRTAPVVRGEAFDTGLGPRAGGQPGDAGVGPRAGSGDRGAGAGSPKHLAPPVTAESAATPRAATPENGTYPENFRITEDTDLAVGGPKARIAQNLAAIKLARALAAEGRAATPDEQTVLAKYVGWGDSALAKVFDDFSDTSAKWAAERAELKAVLTPEEYRAASASTKNAHYTSPEIIRGIYRALEHMGIRPGVGTLRMLEPAAGVGHFLGLTPDGLTTQATMVELDPTTAAIAKGLYPLADVRAMGIQDARLARDHFDLIVGNPPFGSYQVADPAYDKHQLRIHDYFFVKSLDHLRPGGILAFVTSNGTMDKIDSGARQLMQARADFLGAVRLPNTAFKGNAGTDVVTDVLFFRKPTPDGAEVDAPRWTLTDSVTTKEGTVMGVNEYYVAHPENVLGEHSSKGTMYAGDTYTLAPKEGMKSGKALEEAMVKALTASLPPDVYAPTAGGPAPLTREDWEPETAPASLREGWMRVRPDGSIEQNRDGMLMPAKVAKSFIPRATKLIGIREAITELRAIQLDPSTSEAEFKAALREANKLYDAFVAKHGPINSEKITEGVYKTGPNAGKEFRTIRRPNVDGFKSDPSYPVVAALESYDAATNTAQKSDILLRRVLSAPVEITSVASPADAIGPTLNKLGRLDLAHMATLAGTSEAAIADAIRGKQAFEDPATGQWALADDYLSGNVKQKLAQAERAAAEAHERYGQNVEALKKVIPEDLQPSQIYLKLGVPWISKAHYEAFGSETLKGKVTVHYVDAGGGSFHVDGDARAHGSAATQTEFGTDKANGLRILQDSLNQRATEITYKDSDGKTHKDAEATIAAQAKQEALKQRFQEWAWEDGDRARELAAIYNKLYNHSVAPKLKGTFLEIPGTASHVRGSAFKWSWWQKDAIWRMITRGNTGLFHVVGGGKTFIMIGAGMEMKRLGLIRKPLYVVPNHMLEQFSREFLQLYPNANTLIATKKDFAKAKRREFTARMASHDWDGIIMTHRSFESVGISRERQKAFIEQEMKKLDAEIREAKAGKSERQIVKVLETAMENLQVKLTRLLSKEKKDDLLSFEETGVDHLFVDEAHLFKNLQITSKMRGMGTTGSQRAFDLLMKTQFLEERTPGRGVVLATGTPISNSMGEAYTMSRYLQPAALRDAGLTHFDHWAATFGESVIQAELAPDGSGYRSKERFARFQNIPELITMFRQVADVKNAEDIFPPDAPGEKSRRPPVLVPGQPIMAQKGKTGTAVATAGVGKPAMVLAKAPLALKGFVRWLIHRAEDVRAKKVDPKVDNFLKITTEGRLAAMDLRLVSPHGFEDARGKVARAADEIVRIYKETASVRGTQLVFSDIGTPKGAKTETTVIEDEEGNEVHVLATIENDGELGLGGEGMGVPGFSVYDELKAMLVKKGIPVKQIAFIHDAKTDLQKQQIMDDVRAGKLRVLVGSTEKMGAGMNVQDRLVALHHLDAPWRPSDIEQREGRIVRQGNQLWNDGKINGVGLNRYGTEESFDAYMWQTLERKAGFIGPIMNGDSKVRVIEDLDSRAMDLAEMKAATSGNPLVKEKNEVDVAVQKLGIAQRQHRDAQVRIRAELAYLSTQIRAMEGYEAGAKKDAEHVQAHDLSGDKFAVTVSGKSYTDREQATEALRAAAKTALEHGLGSAKQARLGNIAGLPIELIEDGHIYNGEATVPAFSIAIEGASQYYRGQAFGAQNVPVHPIASVEGLYRGIPGTPARYAANLATFTEQETGYREQLGKPFKEAEKLVELKQRQAELDKVLGKEDARNKEEPIFPEGSPAWWSALRQGVWPYKKPTEPGGPIQVGEVPPKSLGPGGGATAMGFADPFTAAYQMVKEAGRLRRLRKAQEAPERVRMAAVKLPSGQVVEGINHEQALARAAKMGLVDPHWKPDYDIDDGWSTSRGRFVSREEGYRIAERADQLRGTNAARELTHDEFSGGGAVSRNADAMGFADPLTAAAHMLYHTKPVQATVGAAAAKLAALGRSLQETFDSASVTPNASKASRIIRPHRAVKDREIARTIEALKQTRGALDKLAPGPLYDGPRWQAYREMEEGIVPTDPAMRSLWRTLRTLQDSARDAVHALGKGHLDNFIEDYMARVYVPLTGAKKSLALRRYSGRRPMEGPKGFKKARHHVGLEDSLAAALAKGYGPPTDNPLDMVLLKVEEMRRYVMAHRIKNELKEMGLAKFVKASRITPDGYVDLNDRMFTVHAARGAEGETRIRGRYAAPVDVARVVNNFLSPGLRGKVWYDAYAGLGNTMNMVQLGLSAFHLGLVAFDATAQLAAVGMDQVLTGKGPGGRLAGAGKILGAAASAATGPITVIPLGPLAAQYWRGRQVWHAYFNDAQSQQMKQVIDGLLKGGGLAKMDSRYKNGHIDKMRAAFHDRRWAGTVLQAPFAALEGSMYPLLEHIVPRMKLGAIYQMMQVEMAKLPATATEDDVRKVAARVVDAIDARLGQMIYSNRFWHTATKEMMMAGIRSVGWNVGSLDVTVGAGAQLLGNARQFGKGERPESWHKVQYLAAVAGIVALYGAMYTYLHTGEAPKDWKDYYYPRTGSKDRDGNPERISPATYMKDVFAMVRHPIQTVEHKTHPLLNAIAEILSNKNFYGDEIVNRDDPGMKQLHEVANFVVRDVFKPFTFRNVEEMRKRGAGTREKVEGFLGNQAAPREVVRTPAQNKMAEYLARRGHPTRTPDEREASDERQDIREGLREGTVTRDSVRKLVRAGEFSYRQAGKAVTDARQDPRLVRFKMLTPDEAETVYDLGTPEEQALWSRVHRVKERKLNRLRLRRPAAAP